MLKKALSLAKQAAHQREQLAGKRVRVLRAIVYEGEGAAVLDQLARSLPVGSKVLHNIPLTITVSQDEIEVLADPPRIEVKRVDLDSIVGIAPADDGSGGWVVMAVQADPDGLGEICGPLGDGLGTIVYTDILDAAEVIRTGIVWKHDMGEDKIDLSQPQPFMSTEALAEERVRQGMGDPAPVPVCRAHGTPDPAGICDWTLAVGGIDLVRAADPRPTLFDDQPDTPGGLDPSTPDGWDPSTGLE